MAATQEQLDNLAKARAAKGVTPGFGVTGRKMNPRAIVAATVLACYAVAMWAIPEVAAAGNAGDGDGGDGEDDGDGGDGDEEQGDEGGEAPPDDEEPEEEEEEEEEEPEANPPPALMKAERVCQDAAKYSTPIWQVNGELVSASGGPGIFVRMTEAMHEKLLQAYDAAYNGTDEQAVRLGEALTAMGQDAWNQRVHGALPSSDMMFWEGVAASIDNAAFGDIWDNGPGTGDGIQGINDAVVFFPAVLCDGEGGDGKGEGNVKEGEVDGEYDCWPGGIVSKAEKGEALQALKPHVTDLTWPSWMNGYPQNMTRDSYFYALAAVRYVMWQQGAYTPGKDDPDAWPGKFKDGEGCKLAQPSQADLFNSAEQMFQEAWG